MKFKELQRQGYDILIFLRLAIIIRACLIFCRELALKMSASFLTVLVQKGLHFLSREVESHHERFHAGRFKENAL